MALLLIDLRDLYFRLGKRSYARCYIILYYILPTTPLL